MKINKSKDIETQNNDQSDSKGTNTIENIDRDSTSQNDIIYQQVVDVNSSPNLKSSKDAYSSRISTYEKALAKLKKKNLIQ